MTTAMSLVPDSGNPKEYSLYWSDILSGKHSIKPSCLPTIDLIDIIVDQIKDKHMRDGPSAIHDYTAAAKITFDDFDYCLRSDILRFYSWFKLSDNTPYRDTQLASSKPSTTFKR